MTTIDLNTLINTAHIGIINKDPYVLSIVIGIVVLFITTVYLIIRGTASKKRAILLMGLTDAGKTLMFTRLVYSQFKQTFTSIKENSGTYNMKGGSLRLIALPGHERIRTTFLEQYRSQARAFIYVIDSSTFQKDVKDVAEYLYSLLLDDVLSGSVRSVLIACTKQDQPLAKGIKVIRSQLEKEMNTVRRTQAAALDSLYGSSKTKYLGKKNSDFTFNDVKSVKVTFIECNSTSSKDEDVFDLQPVQKWIQSTM